MALGSPALLLFKTSTLLLSAAFLVLSAGLVVELVKTNCKGKPVADPGHRPNYLSLLKGVKEEGKLFGMVLKNRIVQVAITGVICHIADAA